MSKLAKMINMVKHGGMLKSMVLDNLTTSMVVEDHVPTMVTLTKIIMQNLVFGEPRHFSFDESAPKGITALTPVTASVVFKYEGCLMYADFYEKSVGEGCLPIRAAKVYAAPSNRDALNTLSEAIRKMSGRPTTSVGITDYRGIFSVMSHRPLPEFLDNVEIYVDDTTLSQLYDIFDSFKSGKEDYYHAGRPHKETILLYGPPGTGKSNIATHLGNKYKMDIVSLTPEVFSKATAVPAPRTPTIYLLEDICRYPEYTIQKPDQEGKSQYRSNAQSTVLQNTMNWLSGVSGVDGAIVIFTSNNPELIVPALIRAGRMDHKVKIDYLSPEAFYKFTGHEDKPEIIAAINETLDLDKLVSADVALYAKAKTAEDVKRIYVNSKAEASVEQF